TGSRGGGVSLRPIESLQPGDWVLAHDGLPHRVLRTIARPYAGLMVGLHHEGGAGELWLTADHRVLALRRPRSLGGQADWSGSPLALRERRQQLRREATPPERRLWQVIRRRAAGAKFRRQHPLGPYVADFYSRQAALVVEVDGEAAHGTEEALAHDRARDEYMRGLGLRVLRVPAREVFANLEGVWAAINAACQSRLTSEATDWVAAGDLLPGDTVFVGPERRAVRLGSVRQEQTAETVLDLEVDGAHSFLTEVCAVHNCGSGTTAYVAKQWGRRWITIDTSRVAVAIARLSLQGRGNPCAPTVGWHSSCPISLPYSPGRRCSRLGGRDHSPPTFANAMAPRYASSSTDSYQ
nr:DUF559 domain-containing protein [Dehalococcoidales bacterium]